MPAHLGPMATPSTLRGKSCVETDVLEVSEFGGYESHLEKHSCFDSKRPYFGWFKAKVKTVLGNDYIYLGGPSDVYLWAACLFEKSRSSFLFFSCSSHQKGVDPMSDSTFLSFSS